MRLVLSALAMTFGLATTPVSAQATVEFNLFELEGLTTARIFEFDEDYTAQFGIPVPLPFTIQVPTHSDVHLISDGAPDGGAFVKFTFATNTEPRQFIENIQIVSATIPMAEDQEDPATVRLQISARALQEQIFPQAVAGFENPEILAIEAIDFGDVPGVHLIGTYTDPSIGPMAVRLTMMLHPDRPEAYFTISNINLSLAPVSDGATLAATLTGRLLNSWVYP